MAEFVLGRPAAPSPSGDGRVPHGEDLDELLRRAQLNGHVDRHVRVKLTDRQRELLTLVNEEPALNIRELADRLKVHRTAAKHHVATLRARGLIQTHRQGRHVLHFTNWMPAHERAALAAMRIGSVRAVVAAAYDSPGIAASDLPARIGLKPRTVRASVRLLRHAGLVHVERSAGSRGVLVHLDHRARVTWARWYDPARDRVGPAPLRDQPTRAMALGLFFLSWFITSSGPSA